MSEQLRRRIVVLGIYAGLLVFGWLIGLQWDRFEAHSLPDMDPMMVRQIIALATLVFIITSALPFIPGAEIGFGLMVIFGAKVAFLVYASMVLALTLSYIIGVIVPPRWITGFFGYVGFKRARELVEELARRKRRQRIAYLLEHAPARFLPTLLRHRYLALIVVFNTPGNSIVGGGGGLALAAGMSGLFRFPWFLATVMLAVAPVPLFFYFMG